MKYLVINKDQSVMIVDMVDETTVEKEIAKWAKHRQDAVSSFRQLTDSDLPEKREFRDAWADITGNQVIDIDGIFAKKIQLERLRKERDLKLAKLDKEVMIAFELNKDATIILAEKQRLRDITEPLKNLEVPRLATEEVLTQIRLLGTL